MKPTEISSSDIVRQLNASIGQCDVSQRKIHTMILDGVIPATRGTNGRYTVNRADLPKIAEIIGMTVAA